MEPMKPMKYEMHEADNSGGLTISASCPRRVENGNIYAFFPGKRRLLIEQGGEMTTYDSGDRRTGASHNKAARDRRWPSRVRTER